MSLKVFMLKLNDLSQTGGTGTQTLLGPATSPGTSAGVSGGGYIGANAVDGDSLVLCFTDSAGNFEVSQCTVSVSGTVCSVSRDVVIASSAGSGINAALVGSVKVSNYLPATLELVMFNLQFQTTAQATLATMAADISDLKDAMTLLLDGGNP
jgi:hypothetical protein